jgi:hypothetical protein
MSEHGEHLKRPARRLPNITLTGANGSAAAIVPARSAASVVVIPHSSHCDACRLFLDQLVENWPELAAWDVVVTVIHLETSPLQTPDQDMGPIRVLYDPGRRVQQSLGTEPAILIVDQWGEIHDQLLIGEQHEFPQVAELASWGRYLATRCPECEGESL